MLAAYWFCIVFSIFVYANAQRAGPGRAGGADDDQPPAAKPPEAQPPAAQAPAAQPPAGNQQGGTKPPKTSDAEDNSTDSTTEEEEDDFTFPPLVTLEDADFERVANIDFGTWSPMDYAFRYFNRQNFYPKRETDLYTDDCFKEYIRCTLSQVHPYPVCGLGWENRGWFRNRYVDVVASFPNTCDLWLHNCRTQHRMFELGYENACIWNRWYLVHDARRSLGGKVKKFFSKAYLMLKPF